MGDYTVKQLDEIETAFGGTFYRVRASLGGVHRRMGSYEDALDHLRRASLRGRRLGGALADGAGPA